MNATDLMVGDWVTLFDKYPAKVEAIGDTDAFLLDDDGVRWNVGYAFIKPIPLTDEILQKNGFDCSDPEVKQYHFTEGKERYHFSLRQMYNKKFSPHPQWKPSEEQMDGLKHFVDWHRQQYLTASTPWPAYEALQSLQTDLLKLKQQ